MANFLKLLLVLIAATVIGVVGTVFILVLGYVSTFISVFGTVFLIAFLLFAGIVSSFPGKDNP